MARKTCELSEWKDAWYIDSFAVAYAETEDFDNAVKSQTKAIELVANKKDKDELRQWLELYRAKTSYRTPI